MDNLNDNFSDIDFGCDTPKKRYETAESLPFVDSPDNLFTSAAADGDFSSPFDVIENETPFDSANNENSSAAQNTVCNSDASEAQNFSETATETACAETATETACTETDNVAVNSGDMANCPSENITNACDKSDVFTDKFDYGKTRYVLRNKMSTNALIFGVIGLLLSVTVFFGLIPSFVGFARALGVYKVEKTQTAKWGIWVGVVAILANLFMIVTFILFLAL